MKSDLSEALPVGCWGQTGGAAESLRLCPAVPGLAVCRMDPCPGCGRSTAVAGPYRGVEEQALAAGRVTKEATCGLQAQPGVLGGWDHPTSPEGVLPGGGRAVLWLAGFSLHCVSRASFQNPQWGVHTPGRCQMPWWCPVLPPSSEAFQCCEWNDRKVAGAHRPPAELALSALALSRISALPRPQSR